MKQTQVSDWIFKIRAYQDSNRPADFDFKYHMLSARNPNNGRQDITEDYMQLRRNSETEGRLVLVRNVTVPQDIEVELSMEATAKDDSETFLGARLVKVYYFITEFDF